MSSSFEKPSVTPLTAFIASARARPWKARCCRSSLERLHTSSPSAIAKLIPGGTGVVSFPLGPCTVSSCSPIWTLTSLGSAIAFPPMRDMALPLPDVEQDLAADAFAGRAPAGHHASRRREHVDAEPAEDARDLVLAAVDAAAGTADALQVRDHPLHARAVLQVHAQAPLLRVFRDLVVGDVALVPQDAGDLRLELGKRDVDS